jgi:hypothetical protein
MYDAGKIEDRLNYDTSELRVKYQAELPMNARKNERLRVEALQWLLWCAPAIAARAGVPVCVQQLGEFWGG